jgi:hypothetical protein
MLPMKIKFSTGIFFTTCDATFPSRMRCVFDGVNRAKKEFNFSDWIEIFRDITFSSPPPRVTLVFKAQRTTELWDYTAPLPGRLTDFLFFSASYR